MKILWSALLMGCFSMSALAQITPGGGGSGGGGGAVTVVDGGDVTQGTTTDAAATAGGTGTVSAKLRETTALLQSILSGTTKTNFRSSVVESNHLIGSGTIAGYTVSATIGATAGNLMVFYGVTTAPSDGAVTPDQCVPIPINSLGGVNVTPNAAIATGAVAVFSSGTSCTTKTASATAWFTGSAQ